MNFKWTTKDMEKAFGAIEGGAWASMLQAGCIVCQRAPCRIVRYMKRTNKWTQPLEIMKG